MFPSDEKVWLVILYNRERRKIMGRPESGEKKSVDVKESRVSRLIAG